MPGKGNRSRGRGRGGHRGGGRGRGSSRGGGRGGGRGRNRDLIPTSLGYVYKLESNVDEYNDDFRVYGQFGSDEDDSEIEMIRSNLKKKNKKSNIASKKQSRLPLGTTHEDSPVSFAMHSHASRANEGSQTRSVDQFAKGKSKYLKTVAFTKSSTLLNSPNENTSDKHIPEHKEDDELTKSLSQMSLSKAVANEPINELWHTKKQCAVTATETVNFNDFENGLGDKPVACTDEGESIADVDANTTNDQVEQNYLEDGSDEFDSDEVEDELFGADGILDDILYQDKHLLDLLEISESDEEDLYDYATLDQDSEESDLSNEEAHAINSFKKSNHIIEDTRKKKSHRTRDDYAAVDPEIFGQSLQAALADVPLGLKPGMRRWFEKQQRKETRKKKKDEAKAFRKEKKKQNKGKSNDNGFPIQLSKIDQRMHDFILDDSINSFQFAPMGAQIRRQIHIMAAFYNLKSKSGGSGESRCTVITKTNESRIPSDRRSIDRFLSDSQTTVDEQIRITEKNRKKSHTPIKKNSGSSTPKPKKALPTPGTIVAFNAPPINEDNVGHRMLAAMGWKQGDALGSKNEGITAPIEAIIRKKNQGLGS